MSRILIPLLLLRDAQVSCGDLRVIGREHGELPAHKQKMTVRRTDATVIFCCGETSPENYLSRPRMLFT